jgi:hypothetical protein
MEPKDKANSLVEKYKELDFDNPDGGLGFSYCKISGGDAIDCAILTVEEILSVLESTQYLKEKSNILELRIYWQSVLTELKSM